MRSLRKIVFGRREKFINLLVLVLNPWWWIIIQRNPWMGILVFILSLSVFLYFWQTKSKKLLFSLLTLTLILFFIAVRDAFDESLFRNSALNIQQYNKRHEFYAKDLGKIYTNKFSLTYFKEYSFPLISFNTTFLPT